jgi:uncharacterized membrane protein
MATLTVWKFDSPDGAARAEAKLLDLARANVVTVQDAATVSWEVGHKKPTTHQLQSTTGSGALGGAFWGLLFGLIFFVPLLGAAIGAATGALAGSLTDVGIDDEFIRKVREQVTPGSSALFLLTGHAAIEKVYEALGEQQVELLYTNLSADQEQTLREAFAEA